MQQQQYSVPYLDLNDLVSIGSFDTFVRIEERLHEYLSYENIPLQEFLSTCTSTAFGITRTLSHFWAIAKYASEVDKKSVLEKVCQIVSMEDYRTIDYLFLHVKDIETQLQTYVTSHASSYSAIGKDLCESLHYDMWDLIGVAFLPEKYDHVYLDFQYHHTVEQDDIITFLTEFFQTFEPYEKI